MLLKQLLSEMITKQASDLYLITGANPTYKINGCLQKGCDILLGVGEVQEMAHSIMTREQIDEFAKNPELNLALSHEGVGRFRVNMYKTRNELCMVIRCIKTTIPSMEQLCLPSILSKLIMKKRRLILFVGATGTGKSSTMASLVDYRNQNATGHIITIEDPIEYIHGHKKSIITQREIGIDTHSYQEALKNTLRQAPDVILIGEIRDEQTMKQALAFSETGHLCLATLHANNSNQAIDRILHFFTEDMREQVLLDLSLNLVAVISQRLLPKIDGTTLVPAFGVLLGTPLVHDLIKRNEIAELKELMQKSAHLGMQTFDMCLQKLYEQKCISLEEALRNADSENNLRLSISLKERGGSYQTSHLAMQQSSDSNELPNNF